MNIGPIRKAVVAAAVAASATFAAAISDNNITGAEYGLIVAAAVAALGSVYGVANKES